MTTVVSCPRRQPRFAFPGRHRMDNKIRAGFFPVRATGESACADLAELLLVIVQAASALAALAVSLAYPVA